MSKFEKLLEKAERNPKGLRFSELQKLCEYIGMELKRTTGSHMIYARKNPTFAYTIQETTDGKAQAYQVRDILELIEVHNLYKEDR